MSVLDQVTRLMANVERLPERQREFARSLCDQYANRGSLSPVQTEWVGRLLARIDSPEPERPAPVQIGELAGILRLFERARSHLQRPAIELNVPGYDLAQLGLRVGVLTAASRYPGQLAVTGIERNPYTGRRDWFGRVDLDGRFHAAASVEQRPAIAVRLQQFAARPAEVAAEYARLTGRCCFCRLALEDERSTAVGYGPVCAQNYGLPWGERPAEFAGPAVPGTAPHIDRTRPSRRRRVRRPTIIQYNPADQAPPPAEAPPSTGRIEDMRLTPAVKSEEE